MQPYQQQQYGVGGPMQPPFYGPGPAGGYPSLPGYPQQPLRLARFPGSELHAPPPGQQGQQAGQQGYGPPQQMMMPQQGGPSRAGSAGGAGRPLMAGPPGMYGPPGMQPFQPLMMAGPGRMPVGAAMPGAYMGPHMGMPSGPYQAGGPPFGMPMPPVMGAGGLGGPLRSGAATPKSMAGSGANTPMHPMQRTLSGGQLLMPPGSAGGFPPQMQQAGSFDGHSVPLMQPPPGIVLPESLSPAAPGPVGLPAGSLPGSRVQSATHGAGHFRGGSFGSMGPGSGLMEPMGQPQHPPYGMAPSSRGGGGLARSGSAGSLGSLAGGGGGGGGGGNSLRGSVDFSYGGALGGGVSPVRRSSERTAGGQHKGGGSPSSRAGSAGRRGVNVGGAASHTMAPPPELDEFDNIKVAVRVRPPNSQELARGDAQALFVNPSDCRQIQLVVPPGYSRSGAAATRNFTFHACLAPTSRQQDVLRLCGITQLLDAALDGYNATVLAYGQTGSGKTFTMSGREDALLDEGYMGDSHDGIITRSLMYLFEQLAARSAGSPGPASPGAASGGGAAANGASASGGSGDGCRYSLRVSFAEIYNEQIYDLIHFDKRQLAVRWDTSKGFHVPELFCKECTSLEETLQVLSLAVRHRRVGSHEMNMESSRSHSIFTVYIDATPTRPDDHDFGMTRFGKVSFVDLAGSERLRDSKSAGETLKETTNINRSIFMLGKVIAALADGAQGARVPYRESKLTKLLQDSLGGSSLSLLIACCSPSACHIEETLSTLSYAARAKNIRNQPLVQVDPEQAALSALKREVKLLRTENAYLREQLFQVSLPRGQTPGGPPGSAAMLAGMPGSGLPPSGPGGVAAGAGSRPPSGGAAAGGAGAAGAGANGAASGASPSPEELMRRLLETQRMLVQFSRENDRLAGENGRLRSGKTAVANDYKGALEEVDWLRTKLEALEAALLSGSLDSGLLAALDGGVTGSSQDILEAARAAVLGASGEAAAAGGAGEGASGGGSPLGLREGVRAALAGASGSGGPGGEQLGSDGVDSLLAEAAGGEQAGEGATAASVQGSAVPAGDSMEPLASMLAAAAQSATSTADKAVAEAAAAAAALAAADQAKAQEGVPAAEVGQEEAVPAGQEAEAEQAEAGSAPATGRAPLIDPYLVANPSELEGEAAGPETAGDSSTVQPTPAGGEEPEGQEAEEGQAAEEVEPAAVGATVVVTLGSQPAAKTSVAADVAAGGVAFTA